MPKQRISKRSKKGWKQFDMGEIQQQVAESRNEDSKKKNIQQLSNDELFTIDSKKSTLNDRKKINRERLESTTPDRVKTDTTKPIKKTVPQQREKKLLIEKKVEEKKVATKIKPEAVYDLWGNGDLKKNKKVSKNVPKLLSKIPHAGQSYNPDENERQQALKIISDKEMSLNKKTDQIISMIRIEKEKNEEEKVDKKESDDEDEDDEETTTGKKKRKKGKPSLNKRAGIKRFKQDFERHKEKKRKREEPSIDEIQDDLSKIAKHQKKLLRAKKKKLEKKSRPDAPLRSVNDVLLSDEKPNALRNLEGNSYDLWMDGLKNLKDSDLFEDKDLNRIKNVYLRPGIPIKDKK
eukprot:gene8243-68_t